MPERVYRLGDRGEAVAEVRAKLARLGLVEPAGAAEDRFDADLDRAVRQFQQQRGLAVDGLVGPQTYRAVDEARWRLGDRLLSHVVTHPQSGDDVAALQRRLLDLGFDVGRVDGIFGPDTERAVRDLQRGVGLPPDGTCGPATFKALRRLSPIVTGGEPDALRAAEVVHSAGPRLSGKTVVVDPGHGGGDPGHVVGDLREVDLTLDLAARVEGRLSATGGLTFLTRGRDRLPAAELDERARAAFANATDSGLCLSLHVDAHADQAASGVATYYYGSRPHGVHSVVGERLAGLVQREIVARTDLVDCRTHAKTWDLLRLTRMPTVRVEIGYLSNPGDAARLADPRFRDTVAEALVVAVQRVYLPPDMDASTGTLRLGELIG
jgi:N-acetylmuramoyl-L-alanine amidase